MRWWKTERGVTNQLIERMVELAGHPTLSHGEPIPTKDGVMPVIADRPLSEWAGTRAQVSASRHDVGSCATCASAAGAGTRVTVCAQPFNGRYTSAQGSAL